MKEFSRARSLTSHFRLALLLACVALAFVVVLSPPPRIVHGAQRKPIYVIRPFYMEQGSLEARTFAKETQKILPQRVKLVESPEQMPDCRQELCEFVTIYEVLEEGMLHYTIGFTHGNTFCEDWRLPGCGMSQKNCRLRDMPKLREYLTKHDRKRHP